MHRLYSLRFLLYLITVAIVFGFFERRQTRQHGHLAPATDRRGKPQLHGEALHELATVLLELYPHEAEPNLLMGRALVQQGKLEEGLRLFEKSLAINRHNQTLLFLYAQLLLDLGRDPDEVGAVVDEIRRDFPRSRDRVEDYFRRASKGQIQFEESH